MSDRRSSAGDMGWPVAVAPALVVLVLGALLIFATDSEPKMRPHPKTAEHRRIQTENEAIQSLNDAMAMRDVPKMRKLMVAFRALAPNDTDRSQLGYGVIADCIEKPGEASLARAKDFYETQRHSPLRRFVRRLCFESRN